MVITEINGDPIDETSDLQTLKARSWVKMKGEVRDHTTGEKKEDFNGLVYPRLYDSKKEITTNGFESDVPLRFMNVRICYIPVKIRFGTESLNLSLKCL